MRAIVIGAGVIGLSCAARLLQAGYAVDVVARDLPEETTSAVAGALWYPPGAGSDHRLRTWSRATYRAFAELAEYAPDSGVRMRTGRELLRLPRDTPDWVDDVRGFERLQPSPEGFRDGWRFEAPVVDMTAYLGWLYKQVADAGGRITRMALPGLPNRAPLVVNCSGLAARSLVGDDSLTPVRGQVVWLSQVGLTEWLLDAEERTAPAYVVPRLHDVVIGGTEQRGYWNRQPDPNTAKRLVQRARELVPELAKAEIVGHRVGLRPARPAVRLDTEHLDERAAVVHCYGHGSAGVTLSWGCADDVVDQVRAVTGD